MFHFLRTEFIKNVSLTNLLVQKPEEETFRMSLLIRYNMIIRRVL